jgi:D-arabinose 1-dehydrogenase-like Zn-dependent alcohol dehydrogenase
LGVDCFVDTSKPDEIQQKIIELSNGGVNAVLNVAASAAAIEASFKYVRCRGTVILIAAPPAFIKLDLLSIIMLAVTIKVM